MIKKLKQELEECKRLWSKYSCDCLHFKMLSLEKRIAELEFNDGLMTYGYNVKGKLVRKVK